MQELEKEVHLLIFFVEMTVTGFKMSQCHGINTAVAGNAKKYELNKGVT